MQTISRTFAAVSAKQLSQGSRFALGVGVAGCTSVAAVAATKGGSKVSWDQLSQGGSTSSSAVIAAFGGSQLFQRIAAEQTKSILQRDEEDGEKLTKGIDLAIAKNVIPSEVKVEPIQKVDVFNKEPEMVCKEIIGHLGSAAQTGCVITLQGLSGTGKGTTVAMLKNQLPRAVTWSNGNIFRSLTLLAVTYAEQNNILLTEALTPDNLDKFVKMLSFGKFNGKFDVHIKGLGIDAYISKVENTLLKEGRVGKNIPTVAEVTQGEVINFVQAVLQAMADDGMSVLVEGREQTLNYIRTSHRFELVLSDEQIIGKRRAAQIMVAKAHSQITSDDAVMHNLTDVLNNWKN